MKKLYLIFILLLVGGIAFGLYQRGSAPKSARDTSSPTGLQQEFEEAVVIHKCNGELTPELTEGPYYKEGSPERDSLIDQGVGGTKITVLGHVYDSDCQPVPGAWVDFWQADANGVYDNEGYTLRGHQYTDSEGMYELRTILPAAYGSRPPHIHVKLRASDASPTITTQLFFPDMPANAADAILDKRLLITYERGRYESRAHYNFVIPRK